MFSNSVSHQMAWANGRQYLLDSECFVYRFESLADRLQWQDDLVIVGALAALKLGPAAGNLGGACAAAAELLVPYAPIVLDRKPLLSR